MKSKKWICLSGGLLILSITLAQVHAEGKFTQKHHHWESRVIVNDNQVAFRALTTYAEASDFVVLALDRYPSNCSIQFISMNVVLNAPAKYTYDSKQFFGALRIDEMTVHNINYALSAKVGEQVAFVSLTNFEKRTTILDELRRGANVRLKLTTDNEEFYLRFSLLGFTAASNRTLELCT